MFFRNKIDCCVRLIFAVFQERTSCARAPYHPWFARPEKPQKLTARNSRFYQSICLSITLFFSAIGFAQTIIETLPKHGEQYIITQIKSARHNLKITMYGFTDKKIAQALIQQQQRGVKVQLLIENSPYQASNENDHILQRLQRAHIAIHYANPDFPLTHQKSMIIDEQYAILLTGNFTYSGLYRQRNFIAITNNKNTIKNLNQLFESDWNHSIYSASGNTKDLITSPENTAITLLDFIDNTQQQLDIYALELTDQSIIHALLKKSTAVKVKILVNNSTMVFSRKKLCRHAVEIHKLLHLQQHAKVLLRDYADSNALAYVGSANLSYYGLNKNRETGILLSDEAALKQLHLTFEKDWKNSISIC